MSTAATADAAPSTAPTPTVAFAPSTDNAATRGGRGRGSRDKGGRGEGRGGRGGRGRGVVPSGRVFFTGSEKSASTTTKRKAATAEEREKKKETENIEEVVGQLDIAIGGTNESKGPIDKLSRSEGRPVGYDDNEAPQYGSVSMSLQGVTYDSDSSKEEDSGKNTGGKTSRLPPLELPFPTQPLPVGAGELQRPVAYTSSASLATADTPTESSRTVSPFVTDQEAENSTLEKDSWFLVQLPTRLPPLKSTAAEDPEPAYSTGDPMDDVPTTNAEDNSLFGGGVSEVVTPPLVENSHDNTLTNTAKGKLGKIIVYKSGRTVLKMEGPEGCPPILMDVNEGLTCSFLQEAVVLNPQEGKYVGLGKVKKSMVVTPDLTTAYALQSSPG